MPYYRFASSDDVQQASTTALDLADEKAARAVAMRYLSHILDVGPSAAPTGGQWRVEVLNDEGSLLFTLVTVAVEARRTPQVGLINIYD